MEKAQVIKITKNLPHIVGIAPNAFSRVVASTFFPNFSIVCFKNRGETGDISRDIEVYCIEKLLNDAYIERNNAYEILKIPQVVDFINSKKNPYLLTYKPTLGVERIALENNWRLIANSPSVKYEIENKLAFRNLLKEAAIEEIIGETVPYKELNKKLFEKLLAKYGPKIVFQIAEITTGGGTGTAFLKDVNDFDRFKGKFDKKKETITAIENVNVTKFIEGVPTSIAGCATRYGVITGRIQTQILDIPEVRTLSDGSGLFCGHDFSYGDFSRELNLQAQTIAKKFGEYIYKNLGYKGIFGLDLITNPQEEKVYVVECNPRFTDAFPLLSEMYISKGQIPMDVFHIFEHMGVDYKINVDEISESYANKGSASQIILETKTDNWTKVTGDLKPGIYKIERERFTSKEKTKEKVVKLATVNKGKNEQVSISYDRPGYRYEHIKSPEEFLITEGVPFSGSIFKGGSRILRLIFPKSILQNPSQLTKEAKEVINSVYEKLALEEIDPFVQTYNLLGIKISEICEEKYLGSVDSDADIVNLLDINAQFGFVRPEKISWNLIFDEKNDDIFKLVKSLRIRKHLKNWLNYMEHKGLTYRVINELTDKDFTLWFDKYTELISAKERANIKITKNWLNEKGYKKKKVGGMFMYKDGRFIGGNIFIYRDNSIMVGYGVVEKLKDPNWSLGTLADFLCVKLAKDLGYSFINFGVDTNLYGHHLSVGLLQNKLNLGLTPSYRENAKVVTTKFIRFDKFSGPVVFLGKENNMDVIYVLMKKGRDETPQLRTDIKKIIEYY